MSLIFVWENLFPILKLSSLRIKFTSEIVWWTSVLLMSLIPLGFYPGVFSAPLMCLSYTSGSRRPSGCFDHRVASSYFCPQESKFLKLSWMDFPIGTAGYYEDLPLPLLQVSQLPEKAIASQEISPSSELKILMRFWFYSDRFYYGRQFKEKRRQSNPTQCSYNWAKSLQTFSWE